MNLNVINKKDGKDYKVYDIVYDRTGYPQFLVYRDGEWVRMSAKHFRPYNGDDFRKAMEEFVDTGCLTVFPN